MKIQEGEYSQRGGVLVGSGSGSGRCRSRKFKNGMKKQPQRGLGVARLEKLRLQAEQAFMGSDIHFNNTSILPSCSGFAGFADQQGFVQLQQEHPKPKVPISTLGHLDEYPAGSTHIEISPSVGLLDFNMTWPTNSVTFVHFASNPSADHQSDSSCFVSRNTHTLKSPTLFGSRAISDSDLKMKGYAKPFKVFRNSYNPMASANAFSSTVEDQKVSSFSKVCCSNNSEDANVFMSFANLTNPKEPPVGSAYVDSRPQLLQLYGDGNQTSMGIGNGSQELSSFQISHADDHRKIPSSKRPWDIPTHECLTANRHNDFLALRLASSTDGYVSEHELVEKSVVQEPNDVITASTDRLSKGHLLYEHALNNNRHAYANLPICQEGRRKIFLTSDEYTAKCSTVCNAENQELQRLAGTALFTMITAKSTASDFHFFNVMTDRLHDDPCNNANHWNKIFSPSKDSTDLSLSLDLSL